MRNADGAPGRRPVLVALSGGGDSLALLHLLVERCGPAGVCACVVDHGLRPGSQEEAAWAAHQAERLGVAARLVRLDWPNGARSDHASLRAARHGALYEAARSIGARLIAFGHTRSDQAEAVLIRWARHGRWAASAGMAAFAPAPLWPEGRGLWLARPLLGLSRAELRSFLRSKGQAWREDPSNGAARYARTRARGILEAGWVDERRLARFAEVARAGLDRLNRAAAVCAASHASFRDGEIVLETPLPDTPAGRRALACLVTAASGQAEPPPPGRIGALLHRLTNAGFAGATLGGARLRPRSGAVVISRDPGALYGRHGRAPQADLALPRGREVIVDGRLSLRAASPGWRWRPGASRLVCGARTVRLIEAGEVGVAAEWLLAERAQRLLWAPGAQPSGLSGAGCEAGEGVQLALGRLS